MTKISKNEEDIDVFISYKKTENDKDTIDAAIAQQLYQALTAKKLNVFFSEITMREEGISDYKKRIDAALDSARVLVVIGTKKEFVYSPWLEYEYETFHNDILSEIKPSGKIVSYINGIKIKNLPRTLRNHQVFSFKDMGVDMLSEFVEKCIANTSVCKTKKSSVKRNSVDMSDEDLEYERWHTSYVSDYFNEFRRLEIQAQNSKASDEIALDYVFNHCQWETEEPLYVLDIGCAYGFVSADRFATNPRVKKILCIDNNSRVIERAQIRFAKNEKMVFEVADVEDDDFVDVVKALMLKHDIPKANIIFAALLIHHLPYPCQALRKFRRLMSNDTYIIIRGSDDGSKLCHPHPELMQEIIRKGIEESGLSDRHNGSKLFSQLVDSGFKNVRFFSSMTDLSGLSFEEKEALFAESFAYRIDPYKLALKNKHKDKNAEKQYEWMKDALIRFKSQFFGADFWYCEYDYVAVGMKSDK